MATDWELLDRFLAEGDQGAFGEIVRRHVDMVYQSARRGLSAVGGAAEGEVEDVAQGVFLLLAQKGMRVARRGESLAGWLYRTTQYQCANVRKTGGRRRRHEREAGMNKAAASPNDAVNRDLSEILDEGLLALGEKERQAIVLRYLERQTAAEAGAALEVSAEAVEKRVERGMGKLREYFARRGYAVPAAGVVAVLMAEGAKGAPASAAAGIVAKAMAAGAAMAPGASSMAGWVKGLALFAGAAVALAALVGGTMVATRMGLRWQTGGGPGGRVVRAASAVRPMMMRWDAVVTPELAGKLRGLGVKQGVGGVGYEGYVAGAEKVRELVKGNDGVLVLAESVSRPMFNRSDNLDGQEDPGLIATTAAGNYRMGDRNVFVTPGMILHARLYEGGSGLRVKVADEVHESQLQMAGVAEVRQRLQVVFDGEVKAGEAAVFIADLGEVGEQKFVHASVWQVFLASGEEWDFMRDNSAERWVAQDVTGHLADARRALAWTRSGHDVAVVSAKWEHREKNGTAVQLVGISDATRWRDCWWDGDGAAVRLEARGIMRWSNYSEGAGWRGLALRVEDPLGMPVPRVGGGGGDRGEVTITGKKAGEAVRVGFGSGAWERGPWIKVGETLEVKGNRVTFEGADQAAPRTAYYPGSMWVKQRIVEDDRVQAMVVPVVKEGGTEVLVLSWVPHLLFGASRRVAYPMTTTVEGELGSVDHYEVVTRGRVWVEFSGYAVEPRVIPGSGAMSMPAPAAGATQPQHP